MIQLTPFRIAVAAILIGTLSTISYATEGAWTPAAWALGTTGWAIAYAFYRRTT